MVVSEGVMGVLGRWMAGSVAVVAVAVLAGCGASADGGAADGSGSSGERSSSAADSASPTVKPKAPKLGQPSTNVVKANWEPVTVGCTRYEVAPTLAEGDPVEDLRVFETCTKKLPRAAARATIPKGVTACVHEYPTSGIGPHVEVRLPSEFYRCLETDTKVVGGSKAK